MMILLLILHILILGNVFFWKSNEITMSINNAIALMNVASLSVIFDWILVHVIN